MSLFNKGNRDGSEPPGSEASQTARLGSAATVPVKSISDPPEPRSKRLGRGNAAHTGGHEVTHVGRSVVVKGDLSQETPHPNLTGDFWVQNAVQSMNLVIIGVLFGSPIELRWLYFALSFLAGAGLCGLVYHLASQRKIQVNLEWLFR